MPRPMQGLKVYLFTSSGAYQGQSQITDINGQVIFTLPERSYKVRVDYLGQQFWSEASIWQNKTVPIPLGDSEVMVTGSGLPLGGVKVYVFSAASSYLGKSGTTEATGKVSFTLPAGSYKYRADYQGSQYWSGVEPLVAGQTNPVIISTGGGTFAFTVKRSETEPLSGLSCYVFNGAGSYLGLSASSDSSGTVSFNLANGTYNFRVDYLGYQFWSDIFSVPASLSGTLMIPHQDVVIRVEGLSQGIPEALGDVSVYLFTSSGSYQGQSRISDGSGEATFSLPERSYKIRADYLGQQFWSESFTWQDTTITIPMGEAEVTVTGSGLPLSGVKVYVFSAAGSYLGKSGTTEATGKVSFTLPAGSYKYRADYQGSQYWSGVEPLVAGQTNPLVISTGGGVFSLGVRKGVADPLVEVNCYVFNGAGSYLGMSRATDENGTVSFNLADGIYKFRLDYLGYQFWSEIYSVPSTLSAEMSIPHQDVVITVQGVGQAPVPLPGLNVYLFTTAGSYQGQHRVTDGSGQVSFNLPGQPYKVRVDYLGQQFWSEVFISQNTTVNIPMGEAEVTVMGAGFPLSGVKVYVFSPSGSYLGISRTTEANGKVFFTLAAGPYKLRADYQGNQYWSAEETLFAGQVNPITIVTIPAASEVPDVVGLSQADAGAAINAAKLIIGTTAHQYSEMVPEGLVISQNPAAGTTVERGSPVDIVVSLGPVPQPTVNITATPQIIRPGESTTLSWTSTNAESCGIVPGIGSVDLNGSLEVSPAATTTYVITATGPGGTASASAAVTVEEISPPTPEQKLVGSGGESYDRFGTSVAINGNYAIVGSPNHYAGAAYVFSRVDSSWIEAGRLTASDGEGEDEFGGSVAISGDYAIVGAPYHDVGGYRGYAGAAYVFVLVDSSWIEAGRLTASDGEEWDEFGGSVAISGDYAIVGAPYQSEAAGAAYIFKREGSLWVEQLKLTRSDPESWDLFGCSVAIDGDYAIVGARFKANDEVGGYGGNGGSGLYAGAAYVFKREGSNWTEETKLTPSNAKSSANFGASVSVSGDYTIVGAPHHDVEGAGYEGAVYIFRREGSAWVEQTALIGSHPEAYANFGTSVSISDDYAIAGAPRADAGEYGGYADAGAAYVFKRSGSSWSELVRLTATDGQEYDEFGSSVAISGSYIIVGAPYGEGSGGGGSDAGAAYIYSLEILDQIPAVSIDANPESILLGEPSTLSWTSVNAEYCVIEPGIGSVGLTGSIVVSPDQTTTYTIIAVGPQGTATSSVTVQVNTPVPVVNFDANPALICGGESVILTWASANADSLAIDQGIGGVAANGSTTVSPIETTTYTIIATGQYGTSTASATVTLNCKPEIALATPARGDNIASDSFTIRWTDNDPDSNAMVSLYYDSDGHGTNGTLIIAGLNGDMDGSSDEYLWETSQLPDGIYHVYAVIDDGVNAPVISYGTGVVTIDRSPPFVTEAKVTANDTAAGDLYGNTVSIDGDYAIVGAPGSGDSGAAYIYKREGTVWVEQARLTASDGQNGDQFGASVAMSGDYAVVSAPYHGSGVIHIFKREGINWNQQTKLTISGDFTVIGKVAISGDYVAVSLWSFYPTHVWRIGIFRRNGLIWAQQTLLQATDPGTGFGGSLAIDGDYLLAGVTEEHYWGWPYVGVEVYKGDGNNWVKQGTLIHRDFSIYDGFGGSVSIDGEYAIIGAPGSRPGGYYYSGAAYIFRRSGSVWVQEAKLVPDNLMEDLYFGAPVDIEGDSAIVGIPLDDTEGNAMGAVAVYKRMGATWVRQEVIRTRDADRYSGFGDSLAISGDYAIIGASADNRNGDYSGSAFFYHVMAVDISTSSSSVFAGASTTLSWNCVNATSVSIGHGIGAVPIQGSVTVSPTETTTYTITATFPWGTYTDSVTVTVVPLTISINSPVSGATVSKAEVTVEGTITDAPGFEIGVSVNGIVALVDENRFVANHVPLLDGQNTITATAVDTFGHTGKCFDHGKCGYIRRLREDQSRAGFRHLTL